MDKNEGIVNYHSTLTVGPFKRAACITTEESGRLSSLNTYLLTLFENVQGFARARVMRYLHTMVRIADERSSLRFYCDILGMREIRRVENAEGRFTLIFLAAEGDVETAARTHAPLLELTYNWGGEQLPPSSRNWGHLAFEVDDIYAFCAHVQEHGVTINRPPRDGRMAFIKISRRHIH